ncbi:MAG TPA: MdtA/MuxA family multidrug efflux RND transporter periplasmic adaptor subunit [Patescibacteria group bacterium]|nr:MdtA/MuxA family multidrug efflux RND transporter periplasmic adaptor subunit [Patescibacteria group bacterium]
MTVEQSNDRIRHSTSALQSRSSRSWLRVAVWLVIAVAVLGGVGWTVFHPHVQPQGGKGRFGAGGPVPVVAATAQKGDIAITLNALGTVTPLATVTVKTQISGQLTQIAFHEGQTVHAGDFLAQIDPRPYELSLAQYQGQLLRDQALLREAQLDLERYRTLVAQDSIAKQQLTTQESLVQQYQGTIATDMAQINGAKLNLTYCHIVAPVEGRVGLRMVDQGNYVQTSDANGLVVITQLHPITVIFTLPEDNLPVILKRLHGGATLSVAAYDRSQGMLLATGTLKTLDNEIDTTTGTVKLRAEFDNEDESLFPNQFVNAQLLVDTLHDATIIPTAAIQRGAPGTFVYQVAADNTVTVRPVKLGPTSGEKVAILSGLDVGDMVVVDGADKLREGSQVTLPTAPAKDASRDPAAAPAAADAKPHEHTGEHHHKKDQ